MQVLEKILQEIEMNYHKIASTNGMVVCGNSDSREMFFW